MTKQVRAIRDWASFIVLSLLIILMVLGLIIRPAAKVTVKGQMTATSKVEIYDPQVVRSGLSIGISELRGLLSKNGALLVDLPNAHRDDYGVSSSGTPDRLCTFLVDNGFALRSGNEEEPCSRIVMQPASIMTRFTIDGTSTLTIDLSSTKRITIGGQVTNRGIERIFTFVSDSDNQQENEDLKIATLHLDVDVDRRLTLRDIDEDVKFRVIDASRAVLDIQKQTAAGIASASFTTTSSADAPFSFMLRSSSIALDSIVGQILVNGKVFREITDRTIIGGYPEVEVVQGRLKVKTTSSIRTLKDGEERVKLPIWYDRWSEYFKSFLWFLIGSFGTTSTRRVWKSLRLMSKK